MGILKTKFLCRKKYSGTPERRNTAFFATFQRAYWFCKIRYEYEKRAVQPSGQTALQYTFFQFLVLRLCRVNLPGKHNTYRLDAKLRQQHFRLYLIRQAAHWTPIQQFSHCYSFIIKRPTSSIYPVYFLPIIWYIIIITIPLTTTVQTLLAVLQKKKQTHFYRNYKSRREDYDPMYMRCHLLDNYSFFSCVFAASKSR